MKPELVAGVNGMPKVVLRHGSGSTAEVYLHGAHVTSWIPARGHEMLFLSTHSEFAPGKAIRGGIPIIFPQFADTGPLPRHGWLRTSQWKLQDKPQPIASVTLEIEGDSASSALWHHPYHVELTVTLGSVFLDLNLVVQNPGAEAFGFTSALHTYLGVEDIAIVDVRGLDGNRYIDKVRNGVIVMERSRSVRISAETDRVYLDVPGPVEMNDELRKSRVEIQSSGFSDVVLWNPWQAATSTMSDMGPDDWKHMLCVESAAVATPVMLEPNARWSGTQRLTLR